MITPRCLFASLLLLGASCTAVASKEPWAPVQLTLDEQVVGAQHEAFVYVDGLYRGNFVDGKFKLYLTLEAHEVKVEAPGFEAWTRSVELGRQQYPDGTALVVTPVRAL